MGGKPRAKQFKCWVCYDTGFVQQWERALDGSESCHYCSKCDEFGRLVESLTEPQCVGVGSR